MTGITIALDPGFNFNMKLTTDVTDTNGKTFLTPLTEATTQVGHVYRTTDGAAHWSSINGTSTARTIARVHDDATVIPFPLRNIAAHPKSAGRTRSSASPAPTSPRMRVSTGTKP